MAKPTIPARQPNGDTFNGYALQIEGAHVLSLTPNDGEALAAGALTIRYGARLLGKPQLAIVPGLIALDYGDMLTGDAAWDFLFHRSNAYPRAEVFGNLSDGRDEMLYVRQLDLAQDVMVLAYADEAAIVPAAQPIALIAFEDEIAALPPRLALTLPRFDTADEWRAAHYPP